MSLIFRRARTEPARLGVLLGILTLVLAVYFPALIAAQNNPDLTPVIRSIEPPNWWPAMPAPMLLVRGEHLQNAAFVLSDPVLRIRSTKYSQNGHWAIVELSPAPSQPETIHITASNSHGKASVAYVFNKRRSSRDGFSGFSSSDVMYLIMTDRFAEGNPASNKEILSARAASLAQPRGWHGGNLRGITAHLDYLQTLGITTVWITPVYENHQAESYHGYGATNMYAVDEHYGTLADLVQLASALHGRHMKLVLDMVPNHVGPAHPWVADEPEPDWFHGTASAHRKAQGEFAPLVNPHAAWRDQQDILEGWFADILPDMNQENPDAARYLIQNAIWWVEQSGADGLRIDTFPYVARPFWHAFHSSLRDLYPKVTTVGEIYNQDPVIVSAFAGGVTRPGLNGNVDTGLTTPFDFPSYFAIRDVLLHGKSMSQLAAVLGQDSLYPHPERLVPFLGNHDTRRFLSEDGATPDRLKLAFAILLTMRGMPQIYSGDEIAMMGGDDPDNRRDFPGGLPGATHNAFVAGKRTAAEQDMYSWVHQLLTLRSGFPELTTGAEQLLHVDEDTLLFIRGRNLEQGCGNGLTRILVAVNKGSSAKTITLSRNHTALADCRPNQKLLADISMVPSVAGQDRITLPAGTSLLSLK